MSTIKIYLLLIHISYGRKINLLLISLKLINNTKYQKLNYKQIKTQTYI